MRAKYPDLCAVCDGWIRIGDDIARRGEHYAHAGCMSGADDE